jgi:hypothetical protein
MNKITLSKEVIEALIAGVYTEATNFIWDDKGVSLEYENHLTSTDVSPYIDQIKSLAAEISFLNGAIYQADKLFKATMIVDEEEEENDE